MRTIVRLLCLAMLAVGLIATPAQAQAPLTKLTNLAHLDWLRDSVAPPAHLGHTTYRLAQQPELGMLWTYADRQADGTYKRIGGGAYDLATDTYGQGAFNADDVSRAAVVYLRHWRATGSASSREAAYQLLRGLGYLQTSSGPNAGNVVLWMQPDGTLNPSAEPVELPDPSDSADSYWLARTIWAFGEGYAAFERADPAFARFLRDRLRLALGAVERQVLVDYGRHLDIDGTRVPAWLIADGADATGEALLGLSAYVQANHDDRARTVLRKLAAGVAAMRAGDARQWPYGAVLPWALSRSVWHAWGGLAPAGLVGAYEAIGGTRLRDAALSDAASFTPHLLIAAGPQNGWLPSPSDQVQIAYGAQSRVETLLAAARHRPALRVVAGVSAAWFFGANPSGQPMYDPSTGRTYDGVDGSGGVNRNSGAESTIHGLLAMLALDRAPDVAAVARSATVAERTTWRIHEAEAAARSGAAEVYEPPSAWTGESLWSGSGVRLGAGGRLDFGAVATERSVLMPVVELAPGAGASRWPTGTVDHGRVGGQGDSPAPGMLAMVTLPRTIEAGAPVSAVGLTGTTLVDAVLVQPEIERLVLTGGAHSTALLRSFASSKRAATIELPGSGPARVWVLDPMGRTTSVRTVDGPAVTVTLPAGGTAVVRR